MKKAYLLTLVSLAACHVPHWQPFALDARVKVELPGQPHSMDAHKFSKLKHPERMKIWVFRTIGGTYQLIRTVNPAVHITAHDTLEREAYYDRKLDILKQQKAQGIKSRAFTVAGIKGRDFAYKSHASANPMPVYSRNLVLDSVGYTLTFIPRSQDGMIGQAVTGQRRHFFNSIRVKL